MRGIKLLILLAAIASVLTGCIMAFSICDEEGSAPTDSLLAVQLIDDYCWDDPILQVVADGANVYALQDHQIVHRFTPALEPVKTFSPLADLDAIDSSKIENLLLVDGALYLCGYTYADLDGANAGGGDAFLAKYDGSELAWVRQLGSSDYDVGLALAAAPDGGVYLAGKAYLALPGQNSSGGEDVFAARYDADGNLLWLHQFGSNLNDYAAALAADGDEVYVLGATAGSLAGEPGGGYDVFLARADASGVSYLIQLSRPNNEYPRDLLVDQGRLYVAYEIRRDLEKTEGETTFLDGEYDITLAAFNSNGDLLWQSDVSTRHDDHVASLARDGEGNVWLLGTTFGAFAGFRNDCCSEGFPLEVPTTNHGDVFWAVYTPDGERKQLRQFGTGYDEEALSLAIAGGRTYFAVSSCGKLSFGSKVVYQELALAAYQF